MLLFRLMLEVYHLHQGVLIQQFLFCFLSRAAEVGVVLGTQLRDRVTELAQQEQRQVIKLAAAAGIC